MPTEIIPRFLMSLIKEPPKAVVVVLILLIGGPFLIKEIPQIVVVVLILLIGGFLNGHIWVVIVTYFFDPKLGRNKFLMSRPELIFGIPYFAAVLFVVYIFTFRECSFDYQRILEIVRPALLGSLFFGAVIFVVLFVLLGKRA